MKRQESRHKKQKRAARNHAKSREQRRPARTNVRQGDFRVVARGVRRDDPNIERIAEALFKAYVDRDLDNLIDKRRDQPL